jgi:hypothetical protein
MTQPTPDREREALLEWLGDQRGHVLGVLKGPSDDDLRRPVLPSGWTCLALVRHLAGLSLDAPPARWPDYFGDWKLRDLREIILHVITETATHAGHLDAARELLDGRTWMGPEDTRVPRG